MKRSLGIGYLVIDVIIIITAIFFLYQAAAGGKKEHEEIDHSGLDDRIAANLKKLEQDPSDYETLKALGIDYGTKARADAKKYNYKAVEFLNKAHEMNKTDYETMCYLGSAITMMATTTMNPFKKMSYVNKGTAYMDKAVRKAPDNITVRLTRGFNSKNLPHFLNRGGIALEDFEHLATLVESTPNISPSLKKTVYSNLAELYEKAGDTEKSDKYLKLLEKL